MKVSGSVLAESFRKAGLRSFLPSRMSRHDLANAAEALTVYAWLSNCLSLDESVAVIGKNRDLVEGLSWLLASIRERITFP